MNIYVALGFLAFTLASCSGNETALKETPARATVTGSELDARFSSAWNRKDSAALVSQLGDSVEVLSGAARYRGATDAKERWIRNELPIAGNLRTTIIRSGQTGNAAWSLGSFALHITPPGTKPFELEGNYSFVWEKQDTSWKMTTILIEDLPVKK